MHRFLNKNTHTHAYMKNSNKDKFSFLSPSLSRQISLKLLSNSSLLKVQESSMNLKLLKIYHPFAGLILSRLLPFLIVQK